MNRNHNRYKHLPNISDEDMLRWYTEEGLSLERISKRIEELTGISLDYMSVRNRIINLDANVMRPNTNKKDIGVSDEELVRWHTVEGLSYPQIIERLADNGISIGRQAIMKRINEYRGVKHDTGGRPLIDLPVSDDKLVELYDNGMSYRKIAKYLQEKYNVKVIYWTIFNRINDKVSRKSNHGGNRNK